MSKWLLFLINSEIQASYINKYLKWDKFWWREISF